MQGRGQWVSLRIQIEVKENVDVSFIHDRNNNYIRYSLDEE